MNKTQISFRLANGKFFPLFCYNGPDTQHLTLIPAREGQESVFIEFFHHAVDGSKPKSLGILQFPNLPSGNDPELTLIADVGTMGLLTVQVTDEKSKRSTKLEAEFNPDQPPFTQIATPKVKLLSHTMRWILGTVFVLVILTLVAWTTYAFFQWGKQNPSPPLISWMNTQDGRI